MPIINLILNLIQFYVPLSKIEFYVKTNKFSPGFVEKQSVMIMEHGYNSISPPPKEYSYDELFDRYFFDYYIVLS